MYLKRGGLGNSDKVLILPRHVAVSIPPTLHDALVVCLGAYLVASEVEAYVATGVALGTVLGRALAALGGAVAVAKLASLRDATVDLAHVHYRDLNNMKLLSCGEGLRMLTFEESLKNILV